MNKWLKFTVQEEKEEAAPEPPKILSGTVYSHPHHKQIFFTEDELIFKSKYKYNEDVSSRYEAPQNPNWKYKDVERNSYLNRLWEEISSNGILDAMKHEKAFRMEKIRLLAPFECYPLVFSEKTQGFLYHPTFLSQFPQFLQDAWNPLLVQGFSLISLKGLPWMKKNDELLIERHTAGDQLYLV